MATTSNPFMQVIECLITSVVAQATSVDELKTACNSLCAYIKAQHDEQLPILKKGKAQHDEQAPKQTPKPAAKPAAKNESKPAKNESKPAAKESNDVKISLSDTKALKKLGLAFKKYSEKSMVLTGDTKPISAELKAAAGRFNSRLTFKDSEGNAISEPFSGWIFSNRHAEVIAPKLGLKI